MRRACVLSMVVAAIAVGVLALAPRLEAEGRLRAQVRLAPHCNVISVALGEDDRGLTAQGVDDRCGAGAPAPVSGRALRRADGTLQIALYVHDGRDVQLVSLQLDATARTGTWRDTGGRTGVATAPGMDARRRSPGAASPVSAAPTRVPASAAPGSGLDGGLIGTPIGPGGGLFFPRNLCTYGRMFLGMQDGAPLCDDVVTALPFETSDMALGAEGRPVLAGPGAGGAGVVLTRCGNPACSADNTPVPLSATASGARIAVGADGLPVVAMIDAGTLTVFKCDDAGCSSGVESPVSPSSAVSAIVMGSDGLPLIVGISPASLVRVIHCGDAGCTANNTIEDLPLVNAVASEPKVAIAPNGLPVIAFRYSVPMPFPQVEGGVRLHLCADLTCAAGTTSAPVLMNTDSPMNQFCCGLSLAIGSDGLPLVASHRMFWGLWVGRCGDGGCGTSTSGTKYDDAALPGIDVDLLIGANGLPVMSHHGGNDTTLHVTECRDAACTGPDHPTRAIAVSATHKANVLGSEGLPLVAYTAGGASYVLACGTKGCQVPAPTYSPVPGPLWSPAHR